MQSGNGIDLAAIHRLLTEVAQTVRAHNDRFDRIDARLDSHDRRFDRIDARLGRIDARLDAHDQRFDRIDAQLDSHQRKLNEMVGTVNIIRASSISS